MTCNMYAATCWLLALGLTVTRCLVSCRRHEGRCLAVAQSVDCFVLCFLPQAQCRQPMAPAVVFVRRDMTTVVPAMNVLQPADSACHAVVCCVVSCLQGMISLDQQERMKELADSMAVMA